MYLSYVIIRKLTSYFSRPAGWKTRKEEIAGPDTQFTYPFDFFGTNAPYKNVTLDYVMDFGPLRDNLKVRDAMDPQGGALCYNYDKLWGY